MFIGFENAVGIMVGILVGVLVGLLLESIGMKWYNSKSKMNEYECGFRSFESTREKFEVRFYLVGMMFLIFDIEASYLYTFSSGIELIGRIGILGMGDFIIELGIGLLFIWYQLEEER